MAEQDVKRYWGIRMGEGGRYVCHSLQHQFIAIGFSESLGNLQAWEARRHEDQKKLWDEFRSYYRKRVPEETVIQSGIQAGQAANFVMGMKPGDIAVVPEPLARKVHVAEITGSYQYVENPEDGCHHRHRRTIRWIRRNIGPEELPARLDSSLRSQLTVFSLDKHRDAIEQLIGRPVASVSGKELVRRVLQRLSELTPQQFEYFIGQLFSLEGFSASVTQYVGDKGVDVVGALSAGGLAEITLKIQVKRIRSNVGIEDILRLRGTLGTDEHGAFVTLGGYTKKAIAEAQEPGKKEIMLIDGEGLVDLVLRHYDELPQEYKSLLGLKRREIPLSEQFTVTVESSGA